MEDTFVLSNHNSQIYYAAGNYVFRSPRKGDDIKEISPEITRDPKGTGSALSESPMNERVLYAGTTDGMLWVTKDGGTTWVDLWDEPEKLAAKKPEDNKKPADAKPPASDKPSETKEEAKPSETSADKPSEAPPAEKEEKSAEEKAAEQSDIDIAEAIVGYWEGKFSGGPMPPERAGFNLVFKLKEDKKLGGNFRSTQSDGELIKVDFNAKTGELTANAETANANITFTGKITGESMEGNMDIGGRFQIAFAANAPASLLKNPKRMKSSMASLSKNSFPRNSGSARSRRAELPKDAATSLSMVTEVISISPMF